jgi:hypothetical protein
MELNFYVSIKSVGLVVNSAYLSYSTGRWFNSCSRYFEILIIIFLFN